MPDAVVVSTTRGGDVVAAGLAAGGRAVVHLRVGLPVDPAPEVPVGLGLLAVAGDDPLANRVFGPLVPFRPERAIVARGRVRRLPLPPDALVRLFPPTEHPRFADALARARAGMALASLVGGGREQRSYRDWVVQRHGLPAYERLYAPYARKRFGPPEDLLCGVARVVHGPVAPHALVAPRDGWAGVPGRWADLVDTRTVPALHGVRADGVDLPGGSLTGAVWADLPPAMLLRLLPEAAHGDLAVHVDRMQARHGIEVLVRGGGGLPFETHVVDEGATFFRVVRPGLLPGATDPDVLVVQLAVEPTDPRWTADDRSLVEEVVAGFTRVGLGAVDVGGARVRRLPHHHPVWVTSHLVRLRLWLLHLEGVGVTPFGRAGLASPVDPGTSIRWIEGRTGEAPIDLRELARQLLEPPVLDPPERPRLRDFIVA